jgi:hypothetical protein
MARQNAVWRPWTAHRPAICAPLLHLGSSRRFGSCPPFRCCSATDSGTGSPTRSRAQGVLTRTFGRTLRGSAGDLRPARRKSRLLGRGKTISIAYGPQTNLAIDVDAHEPRKMIADQPIRGGRCRARTCDLRLVRAALYTSELSARPRHVTGDVARRRASHGQSTAAGRGSTERPGGGAPRHPGPAAVAA